MIPSKLKLHETTATSGQRVEVWLVVERGGRLAIVSGGRASAVPDGALEAVMRRFGAPLDPRERVVEVGALEVGPGRTLRHVRHRERWDVIARDWLVYEVAGEEARCALATTVAGALEHLARAGG